MVLPPSQPMQGGYEFDGFFSEAVKKEYNAMLELYFADLPERPVKLEVVQKPTRPRRNKGVLLLVGSNWNISPPWWFLTPIGLIQEGCTSSYIH